MTKDQRIFEVKEANAKALQLRGVALSQLIEIHGAVCAVGSPETVKETRERAIHEFTEMLMLTENSCAQIIAIIRGEDQ